MENLRNMATELSGLLTSLKVNDPARSYHVLVATDDGEGLCFHIGNADVNCDYISDSTTAACTNDSHVLIKLEREHLSQLLDGSTEGAWLIKNDKVQISGDTQYAFLFHKLITDALKSA